MPGNWSDFGGLMKVAYNFYFKMQFGLPELLRNYFHALMKIAILLHTVSWYVKRFRLNTD